MKEVPTNLALTLYAKQGFNMVKKIKEFYRELRCHHCRRLICYEYILEGRILFICPRCGEKNIFHFKHRASVKNGIVTTGANEVNNN